MVFTMSTKKKTKHALPPAIVPVTGNTERTQPENRAFYPALDGLRAIAFLLVFAQHYFTFPWGWSGVNIFFVLSGFLITGILFDSRNDPHRVRNFYVRRALRIFPLYYGVILVVVLLYPLFHWRWSLYWLAWPFYVGNYVPFLSQTSTINGSQLYLAGFAALKPAQDSQLTFFFGHFWSLCVEEQFYFLWPWIVFRVCSRRALVWICASVVVLDPLLRIFGQHHAPDWMLHVDLLQSATPFQLDSLLLGGLVALLLRGPKPSRYFVLGKIVGLCAAIPMATAFVAGVMRTYPLNWRTYYIYPSWRFTWGLTLINLLAAAAILCSLRPFGVLYRTLSLRPLRWIGRISYGAYIFFDIFHSYYWGITAAVGNSFAFVADHILLFHAILGLACTFVISWFSFEYLESPFLNLKERFTIQSQPEPVAELRS